jgi:hypothetical protein
MNAGNKLVDENIQDVLKRNVYKGYLDMLPVNNLADKTIREKGEDWPDIQPRERVRKLNVLDSYIDKKVSFMIKEKKL